MVTLKEYKDVYHKHGRLEGLLTVTLVVAIGLFLCILLISINESPLEMENRRLISDNAECVQAKQYVIGFPVEGTDYIHLDYRTECTEWQVTLTNAEYNQVTGK